METILFRFNFEINGQESSNIKNRIFRSSFLIEKLNRKVSRVQIEKGGLITLDDDLKVNSQKAGTGKKQNWTVDPQENF